MNKINTAIIIGILLIVSFFLGYSIIKNSGLQEQIDESPEGVGDETTSAADIPPAVLAKYEELVPQYRRSLGTSISFCTKATENIYLVSGSGGFSVVTFYYTENGGELGSSYFEDAIDPNNPPPKPPINLQEYECTVIQESEQLINEE